MDVAEEWQREQMNLESEPTDCCMMASGRTTVRSRCRGTNHSRASLIEG
jgi:hypothetical protein